MGARGASFQRTVFNGYKVTIWYTSVYGLSQGDFIYTVTIKGCLRITNTKSITATGLATPPITSTTPGLRNGSGTILLNATVSSGGTPSVYKYFVYR